MPLFFYIQTLQNNYEVHIMEKKTIYIHKSKNDPKVIDSNEYRVVTFIGGDTDILQIIKQIIKEKYKI